MSRFLMVDIGAGTMDVLYYDSSADLQYKAVVKSPVRLLAEEAQALSGDLLVSGCEMGGGEVSAVLKSRAREGDVAMTASAAQTVHHDPERVRSCGIRIVPDDAALDPAAFAGYGRLNLCDVDPRRIREIVEGLGVEFAFDYVAVCGQDHGAAPKGVSHLDYRHNLFTRRLDASPYPHGLLYGRGEIPLSMNRLRAMADSAALLPCKEVYVMDSGMAAIIGAGLDPRAVDGDRLVVLDVATSHTVGAAMVDGEIYGFFEYHTRDVTCERLDELIPAMVSGRLSHDAILAGGGHGAYVRKQFGFENIDMIIATGPKRRLLSGSKLPMTLGAPMGDNMMTGTAGLLAALCKRKQLDMNHLFRSISQRVL